MKTKSVKETVIIQLQGKNYMIYLFILPK